MRMVYVMTSQSRETLIGTSSRPPSGDAEGRNSASAGSNAPAHHITSETTGNEYVIGDYLGEGSFGVVHHCTDIWENDLVIKFLRPLKEPRLPIRDMAIREMQALLTVRHPFVVPIHDAFIVNEQCCIVSERCTNTLSNFCKFPNFEPRFWVRALARCLLQATYFTQIQRLAHCDIHAGNVFAHFIPDEVDPERFSALVFKLGDYGLARPIGEVTDETTFLDGICPPEIVLPDQFGPIDQRVDIYQVGLLLLQFLLPEQQPFTQIDLLSGKPQDIATSRNDPLFDAIGRMLRRHAEFRTRNAMIAWHEIRTAMIVQ